MALRQLSASEREKVCVCVCVCEREKEGVNLLSPLNHPENPPTLDEELELLQLRVAAIVAARECGLAVVVPRDADSEGVGGGGDDGGDPGKALRGEGDWVGGGGESGCVEGGRVGVWRGVEWVGGGG